MRDLKRELIITSNKFIKWIPSVVGGSTVLMGILIFMALSLSAKTSIVSVARLSIDEDALETVGSGRIEATSRVTIIPGQAGPDDQGDSSAHSPLLAACMRILIQIGRTLLVEGINNLGTLLLWKKEADLAVIRGLKWIFNCDVQVR